MAIKGLMKILPANLPDLEETFPICQLTKATKFPRGPTTYISKLAPGFMLHMYFVFFNVEIIRGFTSTFVGICSYTSHLLGFSSRSKLSPLDVLKFIVNTLWNQERKLH